ncbi:MAG: hypothetical protein ACLVJ6_08945 [Merdibacter sp.]
MRRSEDDADLSLVTIARSPNGTSADQVEGGPVKVHGLFSVCRAWHGSREIDRSSTVFAKRSRQMMTQISGK